MTNELLQTVINFGGFAVASVMLWVLHREALSSFSRQLESERQLFREQMENERRICAEHYNDIMQALNHISGAVTGRE